MRENYPDAEYEEDSVAGPSWSMISVGPRPGGLERGARDDSRLTLAERQSVKRFE